MFLPTFGALLLLASGASGLAECPRVHLIFPCRCAITASCHCPEAHCAGVGRSEQLREALIHFVDKGPVNVKIDFSHIFLFEDFFPPGILVDRLRIRDSGVSWNPRSHPLEPLAGSLRHLTLVDSNLPNNWTVFSPLRKLKAFELKQCVGNVPNSFESLPATLTVLRISWCKLRDLAPGAFVHMTSLSKVELQRCKLERLRRGVFSSGSIVTLSLQNNRISVVEEGAFDNMPNLLSLDLSGNSITSLPVNVFPNNPRVYVSLSGNPYICDCSASWLTRWVDIWQLPQCNEPPEFRGMDFAQLVEILEAVCLPV